MLTDPAKSSPADRASCALAWACDVAERPELLDAPVERPTAGELRALPTAAVRRGLEAILMSRHVEEGLDAVYQTGTLDAWLPEVAALVGFGDGEFRHKDVWKHTKQVVWQSVPRAEVRWGALLHDIGKPKTRSLEPNGEVHFFGHAEVGAAMFRKRIAKRLGMEGAFHDRVHFLILYHLRAGQYEASWTDSAVRRFAVDMGEGLTDLLDLSRADITTKRAFRRKRGLRQVSELGARIRDIQARDQKTRPLPKGLGTALIAAYDIPPSRRLGDLIKALEGRCEAGDLEGGQDIAYYVDYVGKHLHELDRC